MISGKHFLKFLCCRQRIFKWNKIILGLFLFLSGYMIATRQNCLNHSNEVNDFDVPPTLIILATQRGGSSIIGSYFNVRPNVTYLYEPLFPFGPFCLDDKSKESLSLVKYLATCRFEKAALVYEAMTRKDTTSMCKLHNLCFATGSLTTKKISQFLSRDSDICYMEDQVQYCPKPIDPFQINQFCKRSKLIAMKVIYLCSLEWILPLLKDKTFNIKILHLVRDPRATLTSRGLRRIGVEMKDLCERMTRNIEVSNKPDNQKLLKDKFKRIRLEDFILNPDEKTREIFEFAGIEMTTEIKDWLNISMSEDNVNNDENKYGTDRNPYDVLTHWRTEISLEKAKLVQKKCNLVLNQLGYVIYDNIEDLRNTDSLHFKPVN